MQQRTFLYSLLVILSFTFPLFCQVSILEQKDGLLIKTEYGDYSVQEPVLIELINSWGMQRLKLIHQYGVTVYSEPNNDWFDRFDHSIGVFVILRHFGAPLEEQVAGLLHDVSHTVFSHVGDVVFDTYFNRYSYQDDMHEWCLEKLGVMDILRKYGFERSCSPAAKSTQKMFEADRPDICADRIEYLLRGGFVDKLITQAECMPILDDLYFENGMWVFKHQEQAKKLAMIALWLSEHIFGSAWNAFIYTHAADALKRGVEIGLISLDDIHFSTDDVIWQKMLTCSDDAIKASLDKVIHYKKYYDLSDEHDYDIHFRAKCLAIDPWVETEDGIARLSTIDTDYAVEYKRVHDLLARGWFVKLH